MYPRMRAPTCDFRMRGPTCGYWYEDTPSPKCLLHSLPSLATTTRLPDYQVAPSKWGVQKQPASAPWARNNQTNHDYRFHGVTEQCTHLRVPQVPTWVTYRSAGQCISTASNREHPGRLAWASSHSECKGWGRTTVCRPRKSPGFLWGTKVSP
jgi:hypothetical protein